MNRHVKQFLGLAVFYGGFLGSIGFAPGPGVLSNWYVALITIGIIGGLLWSYQGGKNSVIDKVERDLRRMSLEDFRDRPARDRVRAYLDEKGTLK